MPIDIEKQLQQIKSVPGQNWLYDALRTISDKVNNLAENVGGDTEQLDPPPNIQGITVKSSGTGLIHIVLNDNSNIKRNIHYFVEYDTNPGLVRPHVIHLGPSREVVLRLPGLTDGSVAQPFYFQGYSQYPGSPPSRKMPFGSAAKPTAVAPGGTDTLTLLSPTGSGTAASTGLEGASGFGKVLRRSL
jgi:hypothetical protein